MRARAFLRRLWRASGGAAAIEFALTAPIALLMIMGLCDFAYQLYMQALLSGAVQKAGRDATIQNSSPATLDAQVLAIVQGGNRNAAWATGYPSRMSYAQYGYISPEPFTDSNGNGVRDPGECYTDVNGNSQWDANPGISGNGGAGDTVVYTATMTYPRLFPTGAWMKWANVVTISSTTILKNQPYAAQTVPTPTTICT
jgi:Flp pilus assembly protein TadG